MEVLFHTFLTWAQVGGVLSASYPAPLNPGQKTLGAQMVGSYVDWNVNQEEKNSFHCLESNPDSMIIESLS